MSFHGQFSDGCPPPPGVDTTENRYHGSSRDHDTRDRDRSRRYEHRGRDYRHDREDRYENREYFNRDEVYGGRNRYEARNSSHGNEDFGDREERRGYRDRDRSRDYDRDREFSRERDYDRDRDRGRDRERDRSRDRERYWDRDRERREPLRDDWREEIPNSTIMIRSLNSTVTEEDIRREIVRFALQPKDIRLMRKKDTGTSRGFAFVEFNLLSEAVRWKELTQGLLFFDGNCRSTLHYSIPKDAAPIDRCPSKADWTCSKCAVINFRRRDLCFKCNTAREDLDFSSQASDGYDEVSSYPSSTLLFRNLDVLTTEERVLSMLGQLTALPIKSLKVAKDSLTNTSRGFAFVELHSTSEATQLHDLLLSMAGNFFVDGRQVTVSYARRSLTAMNGSASANAASVALAAAQWTNQGTTYSSSSSNEQNSSQGNVQSLPNQPPTSDLGNIVVDGVTYQRYPVPNTALYKYDVTSGYYYDPATGLYYDSNSQYYYNSESQQYLYWDGENQTYLPAPSSVSSSSEGTALAAASNDPAHFSNQAAVTSAAPVLTASGTESEIKPSDSESAKEAGSPQEKSKVAKQDKVKIAKKIAKDMEKWAKTLNQKKENAKLGISVYSPQMLDISTSQGSSADAGFAVLEKRTSLAERNALVAQVLQAEKDRKLASLVAAYGGESDSEPEIEMSDEGSKAFDIVKAEELKLTDWTKMACLMCKRQFPTKDALVRHQQLSDLHKQNLEAIKVSKLTPLQVEELEKRERDSGYRDRAKERRKKFGQPDDPPPNKLKNKYLKEREKQMPPPEQPTKAGIGADNIGNKMLKAMGWSEGQGLGKTGQGRAGIIEVQQRSRTAGLGMKGATYGAAAGDSYKDAVKKAMQARYNELSDS